MKSECVSVMNTPGNMIEAQVPFFAASYRQETDYSCICAFEIVSKMEDTLNNSIHLP